MKWGTFIAVDRKNRRVKGANREQLVMEEYMHVAGIKDSKDVLGPFETIITDRDGRTKYTNTELHTAALKAARAEQKRIADEFKRIVEKPEGLIEYCAKESGYPVGSKKLMDYVNRHYGYN